MDYGEKDYLRMKKSFLIVFFFLFGGYFLKAQNYSFKPKYYTILEAQKGRELINQCTRCMPEGMSTFWDLTQGEVENLEANFKKVLKLKSSTCSISYPNVSISKLEDFLFQYIGVYIGGQKFIYINAFVPRDSKDTWKREPVNVCDGGTGFWGALFNLETFEFSKLEINDSA